MLQDSNASERTTFEPDPPLDVLRCVACGGVDLDLQKEVENSGHIVCRTCANRYAFRNGIIDALVPSEAVQSERQGNLLLATEDRSKADDAWLFKVV